MKKLKIIDTAWHIMHLKDLVFALKDDVDFYICDNTWREWRTKKFLSVRSIPDNVHFVPYYEKGKYDLAILHIDQQCANPDIGKRKVYVQFRETIGNDIPIITINHGNCIYPEFLKGEGMTDKQAEKVCKEVIKNLVAETTMISNSEQACKDWGWGTYIRHGINPADWIELPKEQRIITALSAAGCDEYYNRECMVEVSRLLSELFGYKLMWAKMNVQTDKDPEDYKEFLGRGLVYVDTSFRTPLNRARTEAMLSGCCVVQVKGDGKGHTAHDLNYFAEDGKNIILVDNNPEQIAHLCVDLVEKRYKEAIAIGQAGKATAKDKFSVARYRQAWLDLINKILCK